MLDVAGGVIAPTLVADDEAMEAECAEEIDDSSLSGQTVVLTGTTDATVEWDSAGQSVTVGAHEMMVLIEVEYRVAVVMPPWSYALLVGAVPFS